MNAPENYRLIIDCLLNPPFFTGRRRKQGTANTGTLPRNISIPPLANVIREDGSTWHTFFFNMETGEPDHGATCQGYRDGPHGRGDRPGRIRNGAGLPLYPKKRNILMPSAP